MRNALEQGRLNSGELVVQYLTRVATYEDLWNAVITVNPHALAEAEARDRERAQGRMRGPLHGMPIALKDIIHTTDLRTTGGAMAFVDLRLSAEQGIDAALEAHRLDALLFPGALGAALAARPGYPTVWCPSRW